MITLRERRELPSILNQLDKNKIIDLYYNVNNEKKANINKDVLEILFLGHEEAYQVLDRKDVLKEAVVALLRINMNHRPRLVLASLGTLLLANIVSSSLAQSISSNSNSLLQNIMTPQVLPSERTLDASSLVEMIMFGLAGIPVYKAVGFLLPFLKAKKNQAKQKDMGRVLQRGRTKRDLAYAQQLLDLLISVETALEKYGVTEPQCQLRATCEIHKRSNGNKSRKADRNFIKLVNEMRREIQNPKVVPLAKYVFEYYEEAAIRGEQRCDCQEKYPKCVANLQTFLKKPKGRRPPTQVRNRQL